MGFGSGAIGQKALMFDRVLLSAMRCTNIGQLQAVVSEYLVRP